jgi:hypothetical protein
MTEVDASPVDATSGTGAGYIAFLDYAEKKGEVPAATVQNWRGASLKALAIEDDWRDMNLVDFDLEAHLGRFETLRRTSYTASSMKAYRSRAKVGIQAYRLWLANSPDWKPRSVGTTRASRNGSPKKSAGTSPPATDEKKAEAGYVPHRSPLIEYPFPLRPGVRALITLPEDLTEAEAKRLALFVETLAVPDQRAITTGEVPAE